MNKSYSIWSIVGQDQYFVINHRLSKIHSAWANQVQALEVEKRLNKAHSKEIKNAERARNETKRVNEAKFNLKNKESKNDSN